MKNREMTAGFFSDALKAVPKETRIQVELMMSVSDRIAEILSRRGLSQKDFARMMGKSEAEVSRWLGGSHNFTLATIAKISAVLGERIITTLTDSTYTLNDDADGKFAAEK